MNISPERHRAILALLGILTLMCVACSPAFAREPRVSSLSPSSATAGASGFTLTVNGSNFTKRSAVVWNGSRRYTTLVSWYRIQTHVSSSDLAVAKSIPVYVMNTETGQRSGSLSFTVVPSTTPTPTPTALAITTTGLPNALVGASYSGRLTATGGTAPYIWSIVAGNLPSGLSLSSSGVISGTPTAGGTSYFTPQVKDSAASPQAATQSVSITVGTGSTQLTPPPQAAGYSLAFADDFTTLSLSPTNSGSYNWYNPGMFWEKPAPYSNISAANSILNLTWKNGQGTSDTSLATAAPGGSNNRSWRYGYFEARMRWDTVTGAWPAIWLIPVQGMTCGGCEQGELDIFEGQGATPRTFTGTIHDWNSPTGNHSQGQNYSLPSNVDLSQYHTYGVLWVPGKVTWYLDNQPLYSYPTYPIFDQQNYYLIIGAQEGANWSYGNLSGVTASSMGVNIDWVRVWK